MNYILFTLNSRADGIEYLGWCNSSTYLFNIYFLQEQANHCSLLNLCKEFVSDRNALYIKARNLMDQTYKLEKMAELDNWAEGAVCVPEIVEYLIKDNIGKQK